MALDRIKLVMSARPPAQPTDLSADSATDSPADHGASPPERPAAAPDAALAALAQASTSVLVPKKWAIAVAALAAGALIVSGLLWQKLSNIQEELARRSLDAGARSIEARTLAKAAQDSAAELTARLALQESRISEVSLQRSQLEELMQSLSRSRDENLVVDIESAIRLAQQQAQLTGSAEPLIAALRSADQRLVRAAQPRLNPLQRAIAKDTERIRAASLTDVPVLMLKIDELSRMADDLPVANAVGRPTSSAPAKPVAAASATTSAPTALGSFDMQRLTDIGRQWVASVQDEFRRLLRVSRIDQPEAALLSPEQAFFLRENLKLRLLNARLGLLSRQTDTARADLAIASAWVGKYFDASSRKTQAASQLLLQVQSQLKTSELPRLDDTMAALSTAAAGR